MTDNDHDFTIDIQSQPMACLRETMLESTLSYFDYVVEVMRREELIEKESQRLSDLLTHDNFRDASENIVSKSVDEAVHKWIEAQITSMCQIVCSNANEIKLKSRLAILNVLNNERLLTAEIIMTRHNFGLFPEVSPSAFLRLLAEACVAYPLSPTADTIEGRDEKTTKATLSHVSAKGLVKAVFFEEKSELEVRGQKLKKLKDEIGKDAYFTYLFRRKLGLSDFETARHLEISIEKTTSYRKAADKIVGIL
jgi:hypothetical protein